MEDRPLVIVVEQLPAMREVLKATLEEGFICLVEDRDSVRDLLETVKRQQPAFIVMDVELPGAKRFLAKLKDDPRFSSIPVIGADLQGLLLDREDRCAGYDTCFTGDLVNLEGLARRYLAARPVHSSAP